MRQFSWRWLWIWLGVLVAGCGQFWSSERQPAPPPEPTQQPLQGYTLLPAVLTPSLWPTNTATPLFTADSAGTMLSPLAMYLRVTGPACYETPLGSLVCLGQVVNLLDEAVEQVTVEVQLVGRDGLTLTTKQAMLARWLLPSGANGPYRVLFDSLPEGYVAARPLVTYGQIAVNPSARYATLSLQAVSGRFVIDQYEIALSLMNKGADSVGQIIVTMVLMDGKGQVTGFRQVYLGNDHHLEPGESMALTLRVIPQGPNTVAYDAFAEGYVMQR